ncbi:hypothetical protein Hanom_Chr10g00929461 [Helianthus anomalus]
MAANATNSSKNMQSNILNYIKYSKTKGHSLMYFPIYTMIILCLLNHNSST